MSRRLSIERSTGQVGSDVEGLKCQVKWCIICTVDNGERERSVFGVCLFFKHGDYTVRVGFWTIYTLTKAH